MTPQDFISHWQGSSAAELANSQLFLSQLCRLLDVEEPRPTVQDERENTYVFEKAVQFNNGDGTTSAGRVDLYRKGCFVLESKQGSERRAAEQEQALAKVNKSKKQKTGTAQRGTGGWEKAMTKARLQAERYAKALPDEWPPFLIVVDVGHCFDVYADFSQSGKNYIPFPDPQSYRIPLAKLAEERTDENAPRTPRELLRAIWTDPHSLDPAKQAAKVTRELAASLAELAKRLEQKTGDDGQKLYTPEDVAHFLMRCLFTMFAEDVELGGFTDGSFTQFLKDRRGNLDSFVPMLEALWQSMNTGGFSVALQRTLKRFNGGLFEDHTALPVTDDQLELLIEAATARWEEVEPAIFGTLLERALDPVERHKLGAHYTPRAYVERLVMPTIIEPLREDWETVYATAVKLDEQGETAEARKVIREFHEKLCETRVLDPACGSGNFLYVALELMKRLEGEVLNALKDFGEQQIPLLTVDPHQFLGIEINPRAAAIADLVLWIGYLQWHRRTRGNQPVVEPIIKDYDNIECRDAVLDWDSVEPVVDGDGNPVTRWDGRTTKPHPVTGEEVPDESARVQEQMYKNPRQATWPDAEFVVGNPPFVGNKIMRDALGDHYVTALRKAFPNVPGSVDYVMYWWNEAAERATATSSPTRRFGLITTNSIHQYYNRKLLRLWMAGDRIALTFAVPDHPWVDTHFCAAVRIAMTVGVQNPDESFIQSGNLHSLVSEESTRDADAIGDLELKSVELSIETGVITPSLTIGVDTRAVTPLKSNEDLCWQGCKLVGGGFQVDPSLAESYRAQSQIPDRFLPEYWGGRDITRKRKQRYVIDFFGLEEAEAQAAAPALYQHLVNHVLPHRRENNDATFREKWWLFGRPRPNMRRALDGLTHYQATSEVSEHRTFLQLEWPKNLVDGSVVAIALESRSHVAVLWSRIHQVWALASGGRMGKGNTPRYQNTLCFDPFPFPSLDAEAERTLATHGEAITNHILGQRALHPGLQLLHIYNVLEKLRADEALTKAERRIHEQGLVSVLKKIHDDLDAAVFDAYGWPHDLGDEEILQRLVDLNHERAAEEEKGLVRWLRPEFQCPEGPKQTQQQLDITPADVAKVAAKPAMAKKQKWPARLPERMQALKAALEQQPVPASAAEVADHFTGRGKAQRTATIEELLDTLVAIGQARQTDDGRYAA